MSTFGEKYISKIITKFAEIELDLHFGRNCWELDIGNYRDLTSEEECPEIMVIMVMDMLTYELIGEIVIKNKFNIVIPHTRK